MLAMLVLLLLRPCLASGGRAISQATQEPGRDLGPTVVIIAPESRTTELNEWCNVAEYCGLIPWGETLEQIRSWWPGLADSTAITRELQWLFADGDYSECYAMLIGGWSHSDDYSQYREIPPRYLHAGELAGVSGKAPTDALYGDLDDDGLPDIPVWRVIPRDVAENHVLCLKTKAYWDLQSSPNQEWMSRVSIHCDDLNYLGGCAPFRARSLSEQLTTQVSGPFTADGLVLSANHDFEWNESVLTNTLEQGSAIIIAGPSSISGIDSWLCFSPWGFHFSSAPANSQWPLMIGGSCHLGAWDYVFTEDDDYCPISRDWIHVNDIERGPVGWIGPTRGSYQYVNAWFLEGLVRLLTAYGLDFGQALLAAKRNVAYRHPHLDYAVLTYNGIGAPWLRLPLAGSPMQVEEEPATNHAMEVVTSENPVRPAIGLRIAVTHSQSQPISVRIVGLDGRIVRTLTAHCRSSLGVELHWDCRNNVGQRVSSGIYYLKITVGDERVCKPVVVLR